jgi:hypothetical protein
MLWCVTSRRLCCRVKVIACRFSKVGNARFGLGGDRLSVIVYLRQPRDSKPYSGGCPMGGSGQNPIRRDNPSHNVRRCLTKQHNQIRIDTFALDMTSYQAYISVVG